MVVVQHMYRRYQWFWDQVVQHIIEAILDNYFTGLAFYSLPCFSSGCIDF